MLLMWRTGGAELIFPGLLIFPKSHHGALGPFRFSVLASSKDDSREISGRFYEVVLSCFGD